MFDRAKFIQDRVDGLPMSVEDTENLDVFIALKSIAMNPQHYRKVLELNTIAFTKLSKEVKAKVMEGFNGTVLTDKWFRADAAKIAKNDEFKRKYMALFDLDSNTAEFVLRNHSSEIDRKEIEELYDWKFNGITPKTKKKASNG